MIIETIKEEIKKDRKANRALRLKEIQLGERLFDELLNELLVYQGTNLDEDNIVVDEVPVVRHKEIDGVFTLCYTLPFTNQN